jgi:tetratricopeptide (TPR) repeat protein
MPPSPLRDSEHAVYTDHSIPKDPNRRARPQAADHRLSPFGNAAFDPRDLALAYASVAASEPAVRREAYDLLRAAEASNPADLAVASQLAQFYDRMGEPGRAIPLFERVVRGDPSQAGAAVNLGSLYAQAGKVEEAMALWRGALARNPGLIAARLNLAVAEFRAGDRKAAEASVRLALDFDPDNETARRLLGDLRGQAQSVTAPAGATRLP